MDPTRNPFAPGAGASPPELAGREGVMQDVSIAAERARNRLAARSMILVGLRGVGKTVLLDRMSRDLRANSMECLYFEAPEGRSLPGLLAPLLRTSLLRLSRVQRAKDLSNRALRALAGFVSSLRVKYGDIEIGMDIEPEPGLADNGDIDLDLIALLEAVGEAAAAANSPVIMFIDELQYVPEPQLSALIQALHRTSQQNLPILLIGAGLPQLRAQFGNAKSYSERLFEFREIGPLSREQSRLAVGRPLEQQGVAIDEDALEEIWEDTQGYPYFIQEWGKHAWDVATTSPITSGDVRSAAGAATAALDASFFRVRFDRLTPSEKRYLRAMAELGPGPHRSGEVADMLQRPVASLAPVRGRLIDKGMVYSPAHGDTAFTVPLFDQFMRRIMPGSQWRDA